MQQQMTDNIHLGQTVNLFESVGGSSAIDRTASDFGNASQKVIKKNKLINTGELRGRCSIYTWNA